MLQFREVVRVDVVVAVYIIFSQVHRIRASLVRRQVPAESGVIIRIDRGVTVDITHCHLVTVNVLVDHVKKRKIFRVYGRSIGVAVDVHVSVYYELPVGEAYPAVTVGVGGVYLSLRDAEERSFQKSVHRRVRYRQEQVFVVRIDDVASVDVHKVMHVIFHGVHVGLVDGPVPVYHSICIFTVYIEDGEVRHVEVAPYPLIIAYRVHEAYIGLVEHHIPVEVTPQVSINSILVGYDVLRVDFTVVTAVRHGRIVPSGYIRHVDLGVRKIIFSLVDDQLDLVQVVGLVVPAGHDQSRAGIEPQGIISDDVVAVDVLEFIHRAGYPLFVRIVKHVVVIEIKYFYAPDDLQPFFVRDLVALVSYLFDHEAQIFPVIRIDSFVVIKICHGVIPAYAFPVYVDR